MRVVSLVPSVTETLRAWGVDPVAVTRFCEQPDLPTVGGTKNPDVEAIVALRPDLVVIEREENRKEDAEALAEAGVSLHVLHITAVEDVGQAMAALASAVGLPEEWGAKCTVAPARDAAPLPVWVPIWRRPWMTIGTDTYGSSLLAAAGLATVGGAGSGRYPETTLEEAAALGARWVLAPSEPYAFAERHREELERVAPPVFVDGRDLFWWGVRTPGALGRLVALRAGLSPTPPAGR